jgi:hypothetical protein
MREKPPYLVNPQESTIEFDATELGLIDARFASACLTNGDADSFKWVAGGGEYKYTITRMYKGYAMDEDVVVSCWLFTQTDHANNTDVAYLNLPMHEVLDINGDPLSHKLINDISNAAIDIAFESEELNRGLRAVFYEDYNGNEFLIPRQKDN